MSHELLGMRPEFSRHELLIIAKANAHQALQRHGAQAAVISMLASVIDIDGLGAEHNAELRAWGQELYQLVVDGRRLADPDTAVVRWIEAFR